MSKAISISVTVVLSVLLLSSLQAWAMDSVSDCLEKGIFEQITCLSDLAAEEGNASVCAEAQHEGVKYQCYAVAAGKLGDWKSCLEIPTDSKDGQELRDICISDAAEKNVDSELCEKIATANFKDSCYLKVKNKTGDSALCDNISDAGTKSMCTGEPVYVK